MSDLVLKTPVSSLQEYGVAKRMIPDYKLIHTGGSSHNPEFTFRVQVGALWEEGTGRSKQEAKHRAAEKMLKTLKFHDCKEDFKPEESEEMSEFNREPAENYVGQLKDLCRGIHYPEPSYRLEEVAGPSHNRVFKMVCCVSQLQEFGISRTKKQAKQQAASKMIKCLKEVGGKKIEDFLNNPETPNTVASPSMTDQEIIDIYNSLKSTSVTACEDPAAFYKDHHMAYIPLQEKSPTLHKVLNENNFTDIDRSLPVMQDIAKELGVQLNTVETPTKDSEIKFTIMTMSVVPPLGAVGVTKELAAFNLLKSLFLLSKD